MYLSNDKRKVHNLIICLVILTVCGALLLVQYRKETTQADQQWALFINDLAMTIKVNYRHIDTLYFGLELTKSLSRFASISDEDIQDFAYWSTQYVTGELAKRPADEIARQIPVKLGPTKESILRRAIQNHSYLHHNFTYIIAWVVTGLLYGLLMFWVYSFSSLQTSDTDIIFNALSLVLIGTAFKLSGGFTSNLWALWLLLFTIHAFTVQWHLRHQSKSAWAQQIPYGLTVLLALYWGTSSENITFAENALPIFRGKAWAQYCVATLFVVFPAFFIYFVPVQPQAFSTTGTASQGKSWRNATNKTFALLTAVTLLLLMLAILLWSIPRPFRISLVTWIGYGPFYVAKEKGFFKDEHVDVELVHYRGSAALRDLFATNKIEAAATTIENVIAMSSLNLPAKVAMALDSSYGADGIASISSVDSVSDLQGLTVAAQPGLTNEYLLQVLLDQAGVPYDRITTRVMENDLGVKAFLAKEVDAVVTWEPFLSQALKRKDSKLLFSTRAPEAKNLVVDILMVRDDTFDQREQEITGVMRAWDTAVNYISSNPEDSARIIATAINEASESALTPENVLTMLSNVRLFDAKMNKNFFAADESSDTYLQTAERAARIYKTSGFIRELPEFERLFNRAIQLRTRILSPDS